MRTRTSIARLGLALLAVPSLVACGISADAEPRDVPAAQQQELGIDGDTSAGATGGEARIYLLAADVSGQATVLQAVARDVDLTPTGVLLALLGGANASELDRQLRSALPSDTTLRSAVLRGGVLVVDLSPEILQLTGDDLVLALAQIVFSASSIDSVRAISILVEGSPQRWPDGTGVLTASPLTVYDFPGLVASSQPAYPALPSPVEN
jgi:spore germination protein GerM